MQRKRGISIYSEHSAFEEDAAYITIAQQNNFDRIFMCLLSIQNDKDAVLEKLKKTVALARSYNMEVIVDIAPHIFQMYNISYTNLEFFANLGVTGIRLDEGFTGSEEAKMTYNPYNLSIELNMSYNRPYIDLILAHYPKTETLQGCHNFYPQRYTGLDEDFFIKCSAHFYNKRLRTAAFVTAREGSIGPWDIQDGLCTLESHRELPTDVQAKQLWAFQLIDDVIIGDAYASELTLQKIGALDPFMITLDVEFDAEATDIERSIVLDRMHERRGDQNAYMIRSTESRVVHAQKSFPPRISRAQKRGDIVIGNDQFGKYKGELQIILQDMPADVRKNHVGRISPSNLILLDMIYPMGQFVCTEAV